MKQVTSTKTEHNFFTRLESELDEDEIFSSDKPKNTLLEQFLYTCSVSKMSFPFIECNYSDFISFDTSFN